MMQRKTYDAAVKAISKFSLGLFAVSSLNGIFSAQKLWSNAQNARPSFQLVVKFVTETF